MKKRQWAGYAAVLGACLLVSIAAGWTSLGAQFDNAVNDFLMRLTPPERGDSHAIIAGVDEETLKEIRGRRYLRGALAEAVERIAEAHPKAVVMDVIFADEDDPAESQKLAKALAQAPNVVLAANLVQGRWEEPLPLFAGKATAVGHVHAEPDPLDNVVREVALEKAAGALRHWSISLEAYRIWRGNAPVIEDPDGLEIGGVRIPARQSEARALRVRYLPRPAQFESSIPVVTLHQLRTDPQAAKQFLGKVVFVGVTAQSAAEDRHMTPYSAGLAMPGVEINANAFETLVRGQFLEPASNVAVVALCLAFCAAAGLIFWLFSGWTAYALAAALLVAAHLAPYFAMRAGIVFPYAPPFSTAWLSSVAAATYQAIVVRRTLRKTEAEKDRYQKAMQFVAHEMRTPLTAIQGSSELMGRYKLTEEKRAEMAKVINSESKRLARMIQTFLDVERLSEGEMEMKREPFDLREAVDVSLERVKPLAERKQIHLECPPLDALEVKGDRELMEYAVYNLLTNAVKYSPAGTEVSVAATRSGESLILSIRDQGIGMDDKEQKQIFQRFYRTKSAEASGEAGTGIGLSIVEQIVGHHGGRMEVASRPGQGSCFTMVLPSVAPVKDRVN
ncbi:MAG: CHASE2 domain-containing protein [Bryobacteraceae bacterium]